MSTGVTKVEAFLNNLVYKWIVNCYSFTYSVNKWYKMCTYTFKKLRFMDLY